MPLRICPVLTIREVCELWGKQLDTIARLSFERSLTVSVLVNEVWVEEGKFIVFDKGEFETYTESRHPISGVLDVFGIDVWSIFRNGEAVITDFFPEDDDNFISVTRPTEKVRVSVADLVVRQAEVIRFAELHGLPHPEGPVKDVAKLRRLPGAEPTYKWDDFWITVCQRLYENGLPETQACLIRDMLDWFSVTHNAEPDESTVKKKISRLFRVLLQPEKPASNSSTTRLSSLRS